MLWPKITRGIVNQCKSKLYWQNLGSQNFVSNLHICKLSWAPSMHKIEGAQHSLNKRCIAVHTTNLLYGVKSSRPMWQLDTEQLDPWDNLTLVTTRPSWQLDLKQKTRPTRQLDPRDNSTLVTTRPSWQLDPRDNSTLVTTFYLNCILSMSLCSVKLPPPFVPVPYSFYSTSPFLFPSPTFPWYFPSLYPSH